MIKQFRSSIRLLLGSALLLALVNVIHSFCMAEECPTDADAIATDRPDVINSSLVVPFESLPAEDGIDWSVRHDSNLVYGTNTRLCLGVAHCVIHCLGSERQIR